MGLSQRTAFWLTYSAGFPQLYKGSYAAGGLRHGVGSLYRDLASGKQIEGPDLKRCHLISIDEMIGAVAVDRRATSDDRTSRVHTGGAQGLATQMV